METDVSREQELARLVDAYQSSLRRMCCAILRDRTLAEDAVQETFLKAYKALDTFRKESSEKTWLMRIAINTCRDFRPAAEAKRGYTSALLSGHDDAGNRRRAANFPIFRIGKARARARQTARISGKG